uniref:Uncharacterized protein n=1 Tax=Calidris pygmaea TaxID=425635 RepID=A0A8C3KMG3_9CHAR
MHSKGGYWGGMEDDHPIALMATAQAFHPQPMSCFWCPFNSISYRRKCYYFLEVEGNWTSGQANCSALGASLAMLDSMQEVLSVGLK